jgi:hypothetical protein
MVASCELYEPDAVNPFLERLSQFFSSDQLEPIKWRLKEFDFDSLREETVILAGSVGIYL